MVAGRSAKALSRRRRMQGQPRVCGGGGGGRGWRPAAAAEAGMAGAEEAVAMQGREAGGERGEGRRRGEDKVGGGLLNSWAALMGFLFD